MGIKEYRVLQIMNALSMGGGETWLMALLRYLKSANGNLPVNLRFDIVLTEGKKYFFDDEAESLGAKLHYLRYSSKGLPQFAYGIQRILKAGRYHAIHDHQGYPAGIHFLAGLGRLPPLRIAHIHNPKLDLDLTSSWRNDAIIALERRLLSQLATHVMATSEQMIREYGFDDQSFAHLKRGAAYCGFDVSNFRGDNVQAHAEICQEMGWSSAKIMLFAGRLGSSSNGALALGQSRKNPKFALAVAREAMYRDPELMLLLVGEGENARQQFEAEVESWGLSPRIRFLGVRSDLPRLMVGSDLLLFPSIAEGLGMVVVEAQAAGLRVLASDATPRESAVIPELVRFKSLAADAKDWAKEAVALINSPRPSPIESNRLVRNSNFSIENSTARLMELYTSTN